MRPKNRPRVDGDLLVALPYPSGRLHEGNVAGTFLPADVFRRYGRLLYKRFRVCSGLDAHGTGFFLESGARPYHALDRKRREYLRFLRAFEISVDRFEDTARRDHRRYVRRHIRSLGPRVYRETIQTRFCQCCNIQCSDRLLWDLVNNECLEKLVEQGKVLSNSLVCRLCRNIPMMHQKSFLVLRYDPAITAAAKRQFASLRSVEQGRKVLSRYLPWGVATGQPGQVYYVWPEALLAYGRLTRGRRRVRFFHAKDNCYYHGLILRQLAGGLPYATRSTAFVREYLLGGDGVKLSSSAGCQQRTPRPSDRLALIMCDPRTQDTRYSDQARRNAEKLIKNVFINTLRRTEGIMHKKRLVPVVRYQQGWGRIQETYAVAMARSEPKKALDAVISCCQFLIRCIEKQVKDPRIEGTSTLPYYASCLKRLIYPLYPNLEYSPKRTRTSFSSTKNSRDTHTP